MDVVTENIEIHKVKGENQQDANNSMFIIKLSVSTRPQLTHPGMYPIYYQITTPSKPTQPVLAPPITDTRTP